MTLSKDIILALQQLDGFGNKTIFKIAKQTKMPICDFGQLCDLWKSLKRKKFEAISKEDLEIAYETGQEIISRSRQNEIGIMSYFEDCFPQKLRKCTDETGKIDPPIILYYRGNKKILEKPGVAIIGTRMPTSSGLLAGKYFASEFAKRGYNIISGLAIGCDTTGHQGALEIGGTTTAFLANGLDWAVIYPKENLELAKRIVTNGGLLLSEYPIGQNCGRYSLVARDRLQAGLSYATIVIQTGIKGGTMHAVNATVNAGKPLFVVEYKDSSVSTHEKVQGNKWLIQEKNAYSLRSDSVNEAIQIIERAIKTSNKQTSLFD